jgi:TRAP-type C4-dicarboxylate transport system substrate-binding protein
MKKIQGFSFIINAVLCAALAIGYAFGAAEAQAASQGDKTFNLKLSHSMAVTSYSQKAYQYFADACAEESGGTIKIEVFPGSTLVSDVEAYDAVRDGNVDIAQFQVSYMSGYVKEFIVLEIPGIYSGSRFPILHEATKDVLNEIFAKYGVKYVAPIPHDVLVFVGDSLISDPSTQLAGKKIRVAGKWGGEAVMRWGGAPVTINIGDVPSALERGTINLVNTSWIATGGFKLYEMGPHVTFTDMQEMFPGLILNQNIWDSFSETQKAAFDRATERFLLEGHKIMMDEKAKFVATCEGANVEMYTASKEENEFYRKAANELVEQVKPQIGELGLKLVEAFRTPKLQ